MGPFDSSQHRPPSTMLASVAIGSACPYLVQPEIELLDLRVLAQLGGWTL